MKKIYKILIADDNKQFVHSVVISLRNFEVICAYTPDELIKNLNSEIDLVMLDLVFDESQPEKIQGLDLLKTIKEKYNELPVIIMTNYASIDKSVTAIKSGAKDFVNKGRLDWSEWENRILNYCSDYRKIKNLEIAVAKSDNEPVIIGSSLETKLLKMRLIDFATKSRDSSILITGETGTGKNLAVQYFRYYSPRKNAPYQEFSIMEKSETILESELFGHKKGSFTGANSDKKGLFEAADNGIIFLDEIGDYSLSIQSKILKFLENKTITPVGSTKSKKLNVQLIMATNKNLLGMIKKGQFREDLFYRINSLSVDILPLRKRKEDIKDLFNHFFEYYRKKENTNLQAISSDVYDLLTNYLWPGNTRELQSIILKACSDARLFNDHQLKKEHFTRYLFNNEPQNSSITFENYVEKMETIKLEMVNKALEQTYGQKGKAALLLKYKTGDHLYKDLIKYKGTEIIDKFPFIKKCFDTIFL